MVKKRTSLEIIKTSVSRKCERVFAFRKKIGFKTLNLILRRLEDTREKDVCALIIKSSRRSRKRENKRESIPLSLIAFLLQNHGRGGKAPVEEEAREGEEEEE